MTFTVIMKPTHACNLACEYCYVDEKTESGIMDSRTLKKSIEKVLEFSDKDDEARFIWHGGEPLLLGLDFYREIVDIESNFSDHKIANSIQTNGTLLTEDLADFFQKYNFYVGLSLDGPEWIHNSARPYKNGKGSFKDVMKAVKLVSEKKIGSGAISILTKRNVNHVEEIYQFFRDNGINLKVNSLSCAGRTKYSQNDLLVSPEEYGYAMNKLFDMWFYEKEHRINVNPLDLVIGNVLADSQLGCCTFSESCISEFLSIGPEGNVYPCGRFHGDSAFNLGNINEDDLTKIMKSPISQYLIKRDEETKACQPCEYKKICNSGCVHNAYAFNNDINTRDYYCAGYKIMFQHIGDALRRELKKAEVRTEHV
ncbi:MAG: radical SAM protein [Candidatus Aenigmatarchaeota archaeon]